MWKLGQRPVLRTVSLFVPIFLTAAAYGVFRVYTGDPANAIWVAVGTATLYFFVALFSGWPFSTAGSSAAVLIVMGYYDIGATAETLAFWTALSLVMSFFGASAARVRVVDKLVVTDESAGFAEWFLFEFSLAWVVFLAAFFAIKTVYFGVVGALVLIIAFFLYLWWAIGASREYAASKPKPPPEAAPRRRRRRA